MLASTEAIPHAAAMSAIQPLLPPAGDGEEVSVYVANPRAKKSFNTVLDAAQLFDANGRSVVKTTAVRDGAERRVLIETKHALRAERSPRPSSSRRTRASRRRAFTGCSSMPRA